MSNVVSMERTCDYWVSRAMKHRLAGRYDEAMALLAKAKDQFGPNDEIELELARTYDEMDCNEEAARSYLRLVRTNGKHKGEALFQLALSSAQRADLRRALSYFEQFHSIKQDDIAPEMAELLGRQLQKEAEQPLARTKRARGRLLEHRAVEQLQSGKIFAARRTLLHALNMKKTAQRLTLLSCCDLMLNHIDDAILSARKAHEIAPWRVQTLCVLSDALYADGQKDEARRILYIGVLRSVTVDDFISIAMESAKHGEDHLTLRITQSLLNREPFCTQGMRMLGCALINLGKFKEASRLMGRLCGLLPEDTVCQALYKMAREEEKPEERLMLGVDVPHQEALNRAILLVSALYEGPSRLKEDPAKIKELCRLSAWAFRSAQAGPNASVVAMILMGGLDTEETCGVLLDALTDPQIPDSFKCAVLQTLTAKHGFSPFDVDMGGRLVRLAAGGSTQQPTGGEMGQAIVQRAADALLPDFPDAPKKLLELYIAYIDRYGVPHGRESAACSAGLEIAFHTLAGRSVSPALIAKRCGASERLCRLMEKRLLHAAGTNDIQEPAKEER